MSLTGALPALPALSADALASAPQLHHVYLRFMKMPDVARWLLTRDSGTDFLSVRLENTVLVNISSASQPHVLPPSAPAVPFSNIHDLLFLDHVVSNDIALGHIWGKPGEQSHPLGNVPQRVSLPNWGKLQCRRFAANLNARHTLERVEFAWFQNDRLLVTVSASPAMPGSQLLSASELYFFDAIAPHATPQGSPALTVRISDVPLCAFCEQAPKGECRCIRDSSVLLFPVSPPATTSSHSLLRANPRSLSWENYLRILSQSKQNGFLTSLIITPNAKGEPVPRVRLRRAYNLTFGTQEAINEGIHLRLKQMLLARPAAPSQPRPPLAKLEWQPAWPKQHPGASPSSFSRPHTKPESPGIPDELMAPSASAWMNDPLPSSDSVVPLSDCSERRAPELLPRLPVAEGKLRLTKRRVPEKATGRDRVGSGESTPNPFLSTILNPSKESTLGNFAEMSAVMSPLPPRSAGSLFCDALAVPSPLRKPPALPSPISMILDFSGEAARKRARFDTPRDDVLALGLDAAAWDDGLDDVERARRSREPFVWTPPQPSLERPLSSLGVAPVPADSVATSKRVAKAAGSASSGADAGHGRGSGVRCDACGTTFSKRANLVRHTKTVHNNVKPFTCDTCGSRFGLKADLQRHMRNIHEKRAFCCRTCGRSFAAQDELDFHCRVAHEKDLRPYECAQCGMKFGRRSSRRRHEQTVHTQKRFDCSVCDKSYSQRFDAIKHGRKAHGIKRVVN